MNSSSRILFGAATLMCAAFTMQAADSPANQQSSVNPPPASSPANELGNPLRATRVIGMEITGSEGNKLGKISDLALDFQNGRIAEVIVSITRGSGNENKMIAAPPEEFSYDAATKRLSLNLTRSEIHDAPAFDTSLWRQEMTLAEVGEVYMHFNEAPYFSTEGTEIQNKPLTSPKGTPDVLLPQMGHILRAHKIIGSTFDNLAAQPIGKLEDVVVDVPSGRIIEVIVGAGGFLGFNEDKSAVPAQAFDYDQMDHQLRLAATREELENAPHFESGNWAQMTGPKHVSEVYEAYHVKPYFLIRNWNKQSMNQKDRETTDRIRREILAHSELSPGARNVKITTMNGQVTLRGPVQSQGEAALLIGIARREAEKSAAINDGLELSNSPESD